MKFFGRLSMLAGSLLSANVQAASTTNLVFTTQPASTVVSATLSNVVVQIRDARGTNISLASQPVTLTLSKGSGLVGTSIVNTDATGKSVFTNLSVVQYGAGNTFKATASGFNPASSSAFNVTQGKTTNSLTTATNVVIYGQAISVTATIGVLAPAKGTPTGTVTFKDGSVILGTIPLVSTQANFTITNRLLVGTHSIAAVYGGDTNLSTSTAYFTLTVAKRELTVSGITASNKLYNANTSATLRTNSAALTGVLAGDNVQLNASAARGLFADKNAGLAKLVTISGLTISSTNAGNYILKQPTATADITPVALVVSANGVGKIYDGTVNATVTLTDNRFNGDVLAASYVSAQFTNKNIGTAVLINVAGISISGSNAPNYFVSNLTATAAANITVAGLTVSGIMASNKIYDAKTTADLNYSAAAFIGQISGDGLVLITTNGKGVFASKNIGLNKPVTISGLAVSGANASNYKFTQPTTTASIFPANLTVTAKGVNKVYDGTTVATVTLTDNRIAGDAVTNSYSAAVFTNALVGTNKSIAVTGITIGGAAATNYTLMNTTATTAANITAAKLFVIADNQSRFFGVTNPPLTYTFSGLVNGESAGVVTGKPVLATTAKTNSPATNYLITITKGTLAAANYSFTFSNGVLSVLPAPTAALVVSSLNPARTNQDITFVTKVSPLNPGAPAPTGAVRFKCNGTNILASSLALTNGSTTLVVPAAKIASSSAVVVTAEFSDPSGNFDSSSNSMTQTIVILPPTVGKVTLTPPNFNGVVQTTVTGQPGQTFILEASADLKTWQPVSTNVADASGMASLVESNTIAFPQRFYRVMTPQP